MLAVYILYLLKPTYTDYSTAYIFIRKSIIQLVDSIPFILLIVFAILQKTERFRSARWIPVILAASRLFVNLISVIARECDYVSNLTFDMLLDDYIYITFLGLIALMGSAAFFSRFTYSLANVVFLFVYFFATFWTVVDDPSVLRIAWGLASFLWYCAFWGFSTTIKKDNQFGTDDSNSFVGILKELFDEDEPDDDEEQSAIDMLYNEFQKIMVYGLYSNNTAVLKAAENLKKIGEKQFLNADGCVIEKEYVKEQYTTILEFATDDETAKIGSIDKEFIEKLQQLLDGYDDPYFLINAAYLAVIFCGNLDYGIYTALMSVKCEDETDMDKVTV